MSSNRENKVIRKRLKRLNLLMAVLLEVYMEDVKLVTVILWRECGGYHVAV
jgi:hypothetical protein